MRNRYVLLLDVPLFAAAAAGAYILRFDGLPAHAGFLPLLGFALVFKPAVFRLCGLYERYWRYASVFDLLQVVGGVGTASLVVALASTAAARLDLVPSVPGGVLLLDALLTLLAAGGLRLSVRAGGELAERWRGSPRETRRVLIVGAGEAGLLVVRELRRNPHLGLTPVVFVDDDASKRGKWLLGVPVAGTLVEMPHVIATYRAQEVVIAMPTAPGGLVRRVAEAARQLDLRPRILPGVYELLDGHVSVNRLREVEISDLLGRDPVSPAGRTVDYLAHDVVLVTGAGGSIGSELCRQIAAASPRRLILLGHAENDIFEIHNELAAAHPHLDLVPVIADIRHQARLHDAFRVHQPRTVFHAAAHKHVPLMEANPAEAITNNILGTRNVVDCCVRYGADRFVLISTDKAVSPSSIMGATKRMAELITRAAALRTSSSFSIVRFGNVLGSRGSVIDTFKRQIAAGGPITITHPEMQRLFMTIPEAVHLVLQAGGLGGRGDLFVLNMGRPVRITDLARDLVKLSGMRPGDIPIVYTGMRPGEKLVEELFDAGAAVTSTRHDQILRVVEPSEPSAVAVQDLVNRLAAGSATEHDVLRLVREVPRGADQAYVPRAS